MLIPCWLGLALAAPGAGAGPDELAQKALLFAVGAFVMRGAGCAYNDIIDGDFDLKVARTALRPIPSGQISVTSAWLFLVALCVTGLVVLLQFNRFTVFLGLASLTLVAAYPFMKRITWWPQAWLGLTFNWGVLMGAASLEGRLSIASALLYLAGVAWTLGYDTIYAHQDKEDDALIGVKSSARALGQNTKLAIAVFYSAAIAFVAAAGLFAGFSQIVLLFLVAPAMHFALQVRRLNIDDSASCLRIFRSNRDAGLLILAALLLAGALSGAYT